MNEADSEERLVAIAQFLDEWMEDLALQARAVKRKYQTEMHESRKEKSTVDWFRYAAKVKFTREGGRTLHMTWDRMTWRKLRDGRSIYRGVHVRKGKGLRYRTSRFEPASVSERDLIEECENEFAEIRRDVQVIGRLRRTIAYALKALLKEAAPEGSTQF